MGWGMLTNDFFEIVFVVVYRDRKYCPRSRQWSVRALKSSHTRDNRGRYKNSKYKHQGPVLDGKMTSKLSIGSGLSAHGHKPSNHLGL